MFILAPGERERSGQVVVGHDDYCGMIEGPKVLPSMFHRLAQEGKPPNHKVSRDWRFQKEIVECWLVSDHGGSLGFLAGQG